MIQRDDSSQRVNDFTDRVWKRSSATWCRYEVKSHLGSLCLWKCKDNDVYIWERVSMSRNEERYIRGRQRKQQSKREGSPSKRYQCVGTKSERSSWIGIRVGMVVGVEEIERGGVIPVSRNFLKKVQIRGTEVEDK